MQEKASAPGWLSLGPSGPIRHCPSPHFDARPSAGPLDLLVIHNISLPKGVYGGPEIEALFCGQLDAERHPSFADLKGLKVSSHFLIRRDGGLVQFVATTDRAWHAGQSEFQSRTSCNDFSIGIELEGSDDEAFTPVQMGQLLGLSALLVNAHSSLRFVAGHSDIAPGRKTDPGPFFDWQTFLSGCQETDLGLTNPFLKII